jgi:hypothetical protein
MNFKQILILYSVIVFGCTSNKKDLVLHRPINYPQSKLIEKFEWTSVPGRFPGTGSDMHWWTEGIDGNVYITDDDGKNFGGPDWYAHVLKVSGIPPLHKVETINDFQFYDFRKHIPNKLVRRYVCGIVAVDSALYLSVYDYDWNIPSKVYDFSKLYQSAKKYNPWKNLDSVGLSNLGFIDGYSKLFGVAGIIVSHDFGKTWENLPKEDTPQFFGPRFAAPAFLTFGKGNTETPKELGNYVYAISNDKNWASGDHVFLGRVHRDSIVSREAWRFYAGKDNSGNTLWTIKENEAQPVFSDSSHVGHPTISYNKAIKRYILLISSDVNPHYETATIEEQKKWNWESEMQLYESENPWGPWTIFYNDKQWGGKDHTCYLPQMPTSWLSDDGLSGTILFAGDYVNRKAEYYGFMTQSFKITLFKNN